jgi:hypothetical protein
MGRVRFVLLVGATAVGMGAWTVPAAADGPVGTDPSSNFAPGAQPPTCDTDPQGAICVAGAVQYLDQARANLGQPPYQLPPNFVSLPPDEQALVLTNLDRILYGLPPIPGLTAALDKDAAAGVKSDGDPQPSDSSIDGWTSNWAGGYANMPLAYGIWMYDDGPGSDNVDCTTAGSSGCWGHRHDVLWNFGPGGQLAMGAASGADPHGMPGYTMLLAQGDNTYRPTYTYTWNQAVQAGAGGSKLPIVPAPSNSGNPHATFKLVSLRVRRRRVSFKVSAASGTSLQYSLIRRGARGWSRDRFRACKTSKTTSRLHRGRYRLRIHAVGGGTITRYLKIH